MGQERDIQLGKYLLKSRLGKGGMGVVYLATDSRLKRDVAVKVLPRSMSSNPVAVKRFLREARVAASISHPSVVTIHDVDQINGHCFLVMELMTGGTVQDLLQHGPLDWPEATRIIGDACRGLAAIHEAGLIHRDIKPSNLMLAATGAVKLTDFGLVKSTDSTTDSKPLTLANSILGTPHFMSPEQCQGDELDARCDIYSLGATYFALLTGTAPFPDPQPLQSMFAHCSLPVPDPRNMRSGIPASSVAIIMKAMAKKRAERFASAVDMSAALQACLNADRTTPSLPTPASSRGDDDWPDSAAFEMTSGEPGATTRPLIDPRQSTVVMQVRRPFSIDRQRAVLAGVASLCLFVIGIVVWSGMSNPKPAQPDSGSTTPPPKVPGRVSPTGKPSPTVNQAGQRVRLEFQAEFPTADGLVSGVAFASDGKSFFAGSKNGAVRQWDVAARKSVRDFGGVTQEIKALATHQNWLVAGGDAKTVWLWRLDSTEPPKVLTGFKGEVSALAISPDGKRLAVGTYAEIHLYQLDDSRPQLITALGTATDSPVSCYMVMSVSFSSDSRWVAATTWNKKAVAIWDATTGVLRDFKQDLGDQLMAVAFIPHEDRLVFAPEKQGLFIWDVPQSQVLPLRASQFEDPREVRTIVVSPDGRSVVSVGEWGGLICLYDLQHDSPPVETSKPTGSSPIGLNLSADGTQLVVSGGDKDHDRTGFIHLWKVVREPSR